MAHEIEFPEQGLNLVQTSKAAEGVSALVWMLSNVFRSSLIFEISPVLVTWKQTG